MKNRFNEDIKIDKKSDRPEPVILFFLLKYELNKVVDESKNIEKSLKLKEEGIKLFKENKYEKAHKKFTEAIVLNFSNNQLRICIQRTMCTIRIGPSVLEN